MLRRGFLEVIVSEEVQFEVQTIGGACENDWKNATYCQPGTEGTVQYEFSPQPPFCAYWIAREVYLSFVSRAGRMRKPALGWHIHTQTLGGFSTQLCLP